MLKNERKRATGAAAASEKSGTQKTAKKMASAGGKDAETRDMDAEGKGQVRLGKEKNWGYKRPARLAT